MQLRISIPALALTLASCGGGGSPAGPTTPPPPASTIGPSGGTVTSSDGVARLVVPAGALAGSVPLTVQATTSVPLDPHASGRNGYQVAPAGATFALPARLSVRYDTSLGPSGTDEREWRLSVVNAGEWETLAQGALDLAAREASAPITGAGTYGVRWPGPQSACGSGHDREFDFWLGSWNFSAASAFPGTNEITKEGNGCLVEEHFQDTSGTRGRSVSLFSRLDGRWHQTYVDSRGNRLVLIGSLDDGRMVLYDSPTHRFLWQTTRADVVRYWEETSADGGATWNVGFDSNYTRP